MRYTVTDSRIPWNETTMATLACYEPVLDFLLGYGKPLTLLNLGGEPKDLASITRLPYASCSLNDLSSLSQYVSEDLPGYRGDLVCAMDVLHRVAPDHREAFFTALRRQSRRFAILSYPTAEHGQRIDANFVASFSQSLPRPVLHVCHPYPQGEWVEQALSRYGFRSLAYYSHITPLQHIATCWNVVIQGSNKIEWLNEWHQARMQLEHASTHQSTYRDTWILEGV